MKKYKKLIKEKYLLFLNDIITDVKSISHGVSRIYIYNQKDLYEIYIIKSFLNFIIDFRIQHNTNNINKNIPQPYNVEQLFFNIRFYNKLYTKIKKYYNSEQKRFKIEQKLAEEKKYKYLLDFLPINIKRKHKLEKLEKL